MNANEITFGVELETTLPTSDTTPIGPYHHGYQVAWLPEGWKAERDGSIRESYNRKACEFVSPKLTGEAGIAELATSVAAINAHGAGVNETCGLHITLTWNGDAAALARLISLVGNHEKALFASTGTRRRENQLYCSYSKPLKAYGSAGNAKRYCEGDRYHALNLTHLAQGKNRIEFRIFAGTLNAAKILGYVMICIGLVELALKSKRATNWNCEREHKGQYWNHKNAGVGERELLRLFYRLNWKRGCYPKASRFHNTTFGDLGYGSMNVVIDTLTRMARKYDAAMPNA